MNVTRFDFVQLKATKTDEGYLIDTPIVGRVGIQKYLNSDGTTRLEFRPPEEVFKADSLATYKNKPVTFYHPDTQVTAKNAKNLLVGTITDVGVQDGDNVRSPIIIFDAETIDKATKGGINELSLGYTVDLEMTPGEWNGQKYDAIQRNPRINHLAIVPRGRAGNARLNLDRFDAVEFYENESNHMSDPVKLGPVRLDSGLEYQAAPEVIVFLETLKKDKADLNTSMSVLKADHEKVLAERDSLKAQVESAEKVKADALEAARKEVKARADLEVVAALFNVDTKDKTDRAVKELVIQSVRADGVVLTDKTDIYIDAAFDMAVATRKDAGANAASQRQTMNTLHSIGKQDNRSSYEMYMDSLGKPKMEVK